MSRGDCLDQGFMDIHMEEAAQLAFDASVFAKNQSRFLAGKVAGEFFAQVVDLARKGGWTSDEHFSVDGTLIDAWASMKSFRPKDEPKKPDGSNGWSDFKGQCEAAEGNRSNDTHQSKTDPRRRAATHHQRWRGHKPRVGRTAPKTPLAGRKTARKEARASRKAQKTSGQEKRLSRGSCKTPRCLEKSKEKKGEVSCSVRQCQARPRPWP